MRMAWRLVAAGGILVVLGTVFIHWPSAVILAGIILLAAGLVLDIEE